MTEKAETTELRIEPPSKEDITALAWKFVHGDEMVVRVGAAKLCGSEEDLNGIQAVLDSNIIEPEAVYSLQALGIAFGRVFIERIGSWWKTCRLCASRQGR